MKSACVTAALLCAGITMSACTATVDGVPSASVPAQGTPLSSVTSTSTPTPAFTLTEALDGFDVYTPTASTPTVDLFTRTVVNVRSWSDKLGTDFPVPVVIPRTDETACLRDRVSRACDTRIEFDVDQLDRDRHDFGDLPVRLVASHEAGHFVIANAGGDTPDTVDDDAEARANCIAGAYLATDPTITASDAGDAFNHTALTQSGPASYDAFRAGFTLIRDGRNPIPTCAQMIG